MSGPAKFWLCVILTAVAAVFALRSGSGGSALESGRLATGAPPVRAEAPVGTGATEASASGSEAAAASSASGAVTIADAVTSIQARGPAVAVFFSSSCSISQRTVPRLARLAREDGSGVTFLGFAFDSEEDPARLADFLDRSGVGFETGLVQDWAPGEFKGAIRRFGIEIPDPWTRPLVVVVGEDGLALAAWNGMSDMDPLVQVLDEAGWTEGS